MYEAVIEVENCLTKCAQNTDYLSFSNGKQKLFLVFYRFCFLHLRNHFTRSISFSLCLLILLKLFNRLISVWWHYFEYLRCFQHWCVHNICQLFGAWQRCRSSSAQRCAKNTLNEFCEQQQQKSLHHFPSQSVVKWLNDWHIGTERGKHERLTPNWSNFEWTNWILFSNEMKCSLLKVTTKTQNENRRKPFFCFDARSVRTPMGMEKGTSDSKWD